MAKNRFIALPSIKRKHVLRVIKITLLIVLSANILWYSYSALMVSDISDNLLALSSGNDTFQLSDAITTDWDYAYIDMDFHSSQEEPEPLFPFHPLYGRFFKSLQSGDRYIKFVEGNHISRIGYIPEFTVSFPSEITYNVRLDGWTNVIKIEPHTVFEIKQSGEILLMDK
ncbi:MAG: hypothetical protein LBS36_04200 [Oscillospiraceae bacterium]|jgi:hypothetical protein|nr:hypothetical protein [Oscillospiraceae bacterium]